MGTPAVINTTNLSYHYAKGVQTLHTINLQVAQGSLYGFLGPNGSGKTTTLSLVLGLLKQQQGRIEIFGQELHRNRIQILKKIGALIEAPSLYGHLTARENLEIYRPLYGAAKDRIAEVLRLVGLADTGSKAVQHFSLGMKQRLALALALLPRPELLILDEPTNGLDPSGIIELRELMRRLNREEGITILISSHILAEVEKMVSHVGIISRGRMLFQGALRDLYLLQQRQSGLQIHTSNNDLALQLLHAYGPRKEQERLWLALPELPQIADISRTLLQHDLDLYLLQPAELSLENLFITLTAQHA